MPRQNYALDCSTTDLTSSFNSSSWARFPTDEWNPEVIELALALATQPKKLRKNQRVLLTHHKRVEEDWDVDNPLTHEWFNENFTMTVQELNDLYLDMNGREFEPLKDYSEWLANKHGPWYAGFVFNPEANKDIEEAYERAAKTHPGARIYPVKCLD